MSDRDDRDPVEEPVVAAGEPDPDEPLEEAPEVVAPGSASDEARPSGGEIVGGAPGRDWVQSVVVPLLSVLTALAIGALIIIFTDDKALKEWSGVFRDPSDALRESWRAVKEAYYSLFTGALGSPSRYMEAFRSAEAAQIVNAFSPLSETLLVATPLMLGGLSVALGFRAGLFNIGAEGQITAGAIVASIAGFSLGGLPAPIHLVTVVLAGFLGGALYGAIPGVLKAKTGAHEVITTIMLNFIAGFLALYLLGTTFFQRPDRLDPISKPSEVLYPRLFGWIEGVTLRIHLGFVIAIGVAILVAWLLNRSTVGFEWRAVGANPDAARAAGMSPTKTYVVVMAFAGGLAGLAGANQLLFATPSLTPGFASGYGFDAIALALLGRSRPLGVVVAAILFGLLRSGSRTMQAATQTPVDIVVIIQALIIMFIAAPDLIRAIYRIKAKRVIGSEVFTKGWSG
jgi:simple sugar transport system permease protein